MMDPALHEILLSAAPGDEAEVVMLLKAGHEPPPAARIVATFGNVVTCRVTVQDIVGVRNHRAVESLKASRNIGPADARLAEHFGGADLPRRSDSLAQRGDSVVVACVDFGCDIGHPHFRRSDGSTRFLALWDQRRPARAGNRYGYGTIYDRSDIDRALRAPDPYAALGYHPAEAELSESLGSHGTHVLDVAAGSGIPSGVAPGADLIFVHLAARNAPLIGGLGDSVRLLEAVDFIRATAGDRYWSCNCSVGRTAGEHSGRGVVDRALDAVVEERAGQCVILSAGNYAARRLAAHGWISPRGTDVLEWIVEPNDLTPNELEVWYDGGDRFGAELEAPTGHRFTVDLDSWADVIIDRRIVGRLYHRAHDPAAGLANHLDCFLGASAPSGTWRLRLRGLDVLDGRYHAWIERDAARAPAQSSFTAERASPRFTLGSLATGFRTITVAAVDPATREPAPFSSQGPTRDGRVRPDIAAPGVAVLAARSTPRGGVPGSGGLVRMSGTSMAAPHVTGTVALMLAEAPRPLRIDETRALLMGSCTRIEGSDPLRVGAGLLNITEAVRSARNVDAPETREEDTVDTLTPPAAGDVLVDLFGDLSESKTPTAVETLYDALSAGVPTTPSNVEVIAFPRQRLTRPLQTGDVLLRVAPGEPGLGHAAVLADGSLLDRQTMAALGTLVEGRLPGKYARMLERGPSRHHGRDGIARRVTDEREIVPSNQMVIRVVPETPFGITQDDSGELWTEATEDPTTPGWTRAAAAAVGRQLLLRAAYGVPVAVYATGRDEDEFRRQATQWAKREAAVGPKTAAITAAGLRFGVPIRDPGDLPRLVTDLGAALDAALDAFGTIPVGPPPARGRESLIRALALFSHGWGTHVDICGGVDEANVVALVRQIALRLTPDVKILLFGCSVARGQSETSSEEVTTMSGGGSDSLGGLFRDALLDAQKGEAEVWGHTDIAHTTTNPALRRFSASDGKGAAGKAFAGQIVFGPGERATALKELEQAVAALGHTIPPQTRTQFNQTAAAELETRLYKAYLGAIFTDYPTNRDNRRLLEDNIAELAPFYPAEVAEIIRDYWAVKYWTAGGVNRREAAAAVVAKLSLPRSTPTPTPAPTRSPTPSATPAPAPTPVPARR